MEKQDKGLFCTPCPCCHTRLWIDPESKTVIKTEKAPKKKSSLEDLLVKEKKKKEEADQRFMSTAELARKKKEEARDKFAQAFGNLDKNDD
jgi:hypothetical protein